MLPLHPNLERPYITEEQIARHLHHIKERVFCVTTKWPQFSVLFKALEDLRKRVKPNATVLNLERAYFYGGVALFAPLFSHVKCTSVDCVNASTTKRWGTNAAMVDHPDFIAWAPNHRCGIEEMTALASNSFDYVIVPNVVHHVRDQDGMFRELARVLKPGGELIVFEGLVRELHHVPDDYIRYTPMGFEYHFEKNGLKYLDVEHGSGVFDVISYAWQMALEYFPAEERKIRTEWFFNEEYPRLQELDQKYQKNIAKTDKAFPMTYVVRATKP